HFALISGVRITRAPGPGTAQEPRLCILSVAADVRPGTVPRGGRPVQSEHRFAARCDLQLAGSAGTNIYGKPVPLASRVRSGAPYRELCSTGQAGPRTTFPLYTRRGHSEHQTAKGARLEG